MTDKDQLSDRALDALFAEARANSPGPTETLLARIAGDAEAELAARHAVPRRGPVAKPGLWAGLLAALGGWPALAGLATATVAGVLIGYAGPSALTDSAVATWLPGGETAVYGLEDIVPDLGEYSTLLEEG